MSGGRGCPRAAGRRAVLLVLVLVLVAGSTGACHRTSRPIELRVFAAASLQDALRALQASYQKRHSDVHVQLNFAGSNALARQIDASHAADLFFSADEKWMDLLESHHLLVPGTRVSLLTNALVIVARADSPVVVSKPSDLATAHYRHLVLADPDAVPAGRYAKRYLESVQLDGSTLWEKVRGRVMPALDVRAALAAVAADPGRVGIVYCSDLMANHAVRALYRVPPKVGPPIRYPVALIAGRAHRAAARKLLEFLKSPMAGAVYRRFGFEMLGASPAPKRADR